MTLLSISDLRQKNSNKPLQIIRRAWDMPPNERIQQLVVVSAYTDVKAIKTLIKELRSESTKSIKLILDYGASGYHRDDGTTKELDEIARSIERNFPMDSGVFLVQIGRFLHSKIILLQTSENRTLASVGSLNFTFRGLNSNEEVIYNIDKPKSVIEYVNKLKKNGAIKIPFQREKTSITHTYRDWMLQGALFYEDKESNPFNFKLNLPEEIRQQVSEITGLPAETPDNLTITYVLDIPRSKEKLGWKKFCIPTCYGHWCPKQLVGEATKSISKKIESTIRDRITPILGDESSLKRLYLEKFESIEENIEKYNKIHNKNYKWDKNKAISRLDNWLRKTLSKLQNDEQLRRLVAGVSGPVVVPDFWSGDLLALQEFEQSFCEHVVVELSKNKVQNWIARWLREYFSGDHPFNGNWDETWSDEDSWHTWLKKQDQDPFFELPGEWIHEKIDPHWGS